MHWNNDFIRYHFVPRVRLHRTNELLSQFIQNSNWGVVAVFSCESQNNNEFESNSHAGFCFLGSNDCHGEQLTDLFREEFLVVTVGL